MKRTTIILICVLISIFQYGNAQYAYSGGISFDYSTPSNSMGMGLEFSLLGNRNSTFWLSLGGNFGTEHGIRDRDLSSSYVKNYVLENMRGNTLDDFYYTDMKGGFFYGGHLALNKVFKLSSEADYEKRIRNVTDWFVVSLGVRVINHPSTQAEYRVTSHDIEWQYSDIIALPYNESYISIGPEMSMSKGIWGLFYSYQPTRLDVPIHTFGIKVNILSNFVRSH